MVPPDILHMFIHLQDITFIIHWPPFIKQESLSRKPECSSSVHHIALIIVSMQSVSSFSGFDGLMVWLVRIVLLNWNQLSDWFMAQIHDIWDIKREGRKVEHVHWGKVQVCSTSGPFWSYVSLCLKNWVGIKSSHCHNHTLLFLRWNAKRKQTVLNALIHTMKVKWDAILSSKYF